MDDDGRYGKDVLRRTAPLHRELRHAVPGVYAGFRALHEAAFTEGALETRTPRAVAAFCEFADEMERRAAGVHVA